MKTYNATSYFLWIYDILSTQEKVLSRLEKKILANALVLNERQEPQEQILYQLHGRLTVPYIHEDEKGGNDIVKGGLNSEVKKLYEALEQEKEVLTHPSFIPGVEYMGKFSEENLKVVKMQTKSEDQEDIVVRRGLSPFFNATGIYRFDSEEKYKTDAVRFAMPDDALIRRANGLGFVGGSILFVSLPIIAIILIFILWAVFK